MKIIIFIFLMILSPFMASSQTKVLLTVGENTMTATLAENEATRELKELLEKNPITIQMNDYGGFEKVGTLPQSFTTSNSQITTEPGDIMLYQGINMVIFYGSNTWSYTRLGKIDGASETDIKQFLGNGSISLTFTSDNSTGIEDVTGNVNKDEEIYDLNGNRMTEKAISPGIYIVNGKKRIIDK